VYRRKVRDLADLRQCIVEAVELNTSHVLSDNPTCRKCGNEEETSIHILGGCEALASFRHRYLDSFFFGTGGHQDARLWGHLELRYRNRAPIT